MPPGAFPTPCLCLWDGGWKVCGVVWNATTSALSWPSLCHFSLSVFISKGVLVAPWGSCHQWFAINLYFQPDWKQNVSLWLSRLWHRPSGRDLQLWPMQVFRWLLVVSVIWSPGSETSSRMHGAYIRNHGTSVFCEQIVQSVRSQLNPLPTRLCLPLLWSWYSH